jgi:hypothetical protein
VGCFNLSTLPAMAPLSLVCSSSFTHKSTGLHQSRLGSAHRSSSPIDPSIQSLPVTLRPWCLLCRSNTPGWSHHIHIRRHATTPAALQPSYGCACVKPICVGRAVFRLNSGVYRGIEMTRGGLAIWHTGHRPGGPLTQCGPVRSAMFCLLLSL